MQLSVICLDIKQEKIRPCEDPFENSPIHISAGINDSMNSSLFGLFEEFWSPRVVGELNGQYVKLAKLKGEFVWHSHDTEDELFLVIKGSLVIKLRDGDLDLGEGELCIVPRGVEHCPLAPEEVHVLLFEPKSTLHTGGVKSDLAQEDVLWV